MILSTALVVRSFGARSGREKRGLEEEMPGHVKLC